MTKPPTRTADPEGAAARRRLRELERRVRRDKLRAAGALTPADRARHAARVRATQAAIREHVATTDAKRLPRREQIGVAR